MLGCMLKHPDVAGTSICLGTRGARGLYERFGFEPRELMGRCG